jgi:hypothetical protein
MVSEISQSHEGIMFFSHMQNIDLRKRKTEKV